MAGRVKRRANLFLASVNRQFQDLPPPKDDPAWTFVESERGGLWCQRRPTREEKLLKAHRIAAEVRKRRGMGVRFKNCRMAEWTAD